MTDFNEFRGSAKRLDDIDIPRVGNKIGVGEDEVHAFMDVEAAGSGFDKQGRPKMLFEPHVFYRNLTGAKRTRAVEQGLAYAKWRPRNYPADSYPTLEKAMAVDEKAALRASSWGLGQTLGENHRMVGYETVQEMVLAFMDDEEKHLEAIVDFIIAANIDDDLKAHRWDTVARVYNGPAYKKHDYAGRMRKAYAKWAKIKDTSWSSSEDVVTSKGNSRHMSIKNVQQRLRDLGYFEVGTVDGRMGSRTKSAILAFRADNNLPLEPVIDDEFLAALMTASKREVAPDRRDATKDDVRDSPIIRQTEKVRERTWWAKILAMFGIPASIFGGAVEEAVAPDAYEIESRMDLAGRLWNFATDNWVMLIILVVVGFFVWWFLIRAESRLICAEEEEVQAYREGRHV